MTARLTVSLVFVVCVSLATSLAPRFDDLQKERNGADSVMTLLMGDSRQIFAAHFYTKADAYFHEGAYVSMFDRPSTEDHTSAHADAAEEAEHEHEAAAHREGRDWIERFGKNFQVTEHSHLEGDNAREILPWLKLSAGMDPHSIEPYVTAAYWLRKRLNKPEEAERFLREGLRANPDSYEILFELGAVCAECRNDPDVARRLWEMALQKWEEQKQANRKPNELTKIEILGQLAKLEGKQGNIQREIERLEELKKLSPSPDEVEKRIETARQKQGAK